MNNFSTTIAAISTPPGKGGVAVIRISGEDAVAIADRCFIPRKGKRLSEYPKRHAVFGDILFDGEKIDDGIAVYFKAPNSYTGEDVAEISCHGGVLVTKTVYSAVLSAGAYPAGPGEFTRRAFVHGKLSLTQTEAIADVLEAKSYEQLLLARAESRDRLKEELYSIHDALISLMASVYARIDYPDEDLAELSDDEIYSTLSDAKNRLSSLKKSYKTGKAIKEGIRTVICGKPNSGKSSLYNCLTGEQSAIVTEYAGTTRDVLHESVNLGRVMLDLYDTAGLHSATDPVEKIGIERSREYMSSAELIIAVFDLSQELTDDDRKIISDIKEIGGSSSARIIAAVNKTDLPAVWDEERIYSEFPNTIKISAKNNDISSLKEKIEELFCDGDIDIGRDAVISGARQYASVCKALAHLNLSVSAFEAGYPCDVWSNDLQLAIGEMAEANGREVSENVVNEIFSHFCVGK